MKIDTHKIFSGLIHLRESIGAPLVHFEFAPVPRPVITIDIDTIEKGRAARIILDNPFGFFTMGKLSGCLLLYIPYTNASKFHFMPCRTIKIMDSQGRLDRYRLTNRTTGKFTMSDGSEAELEVCRNCLKEYKGVKSWTNPGNFSIARFFRDCSKKLSDEIIDRVKMGVILEDLYPENWSEVSRTLREVRHWRCSRCGIHLKDRPDLLRVYPKNGIKTDTSYSNLQVLCLLCHEELYGSRGGGTSQENRRFILQRRKEEKKF